MLLSRWRREMPQPSFDAQEGLALWTGPKRSLPATRQGAFALLLLLPPSAAGARSLEWGRFFVSFTHCLQMSSLPGAKRSLLCSLSPRTYCSKVFAYSGRPRCFSFTPGAAISVRELRRVRNSRLVAIGRILEFNESDAGNGARHSF